MHPVEPVLDVIVQAIESAATHVDHPLLVALDGGSGAGKSTVAAELTRRVPATVVPLDDFYAIDIPDHLWDEMPVERRLARVFDWDRVRQLALLPLLAGEEASWCPIDFERGIRRDGTYRLKPVPVALPPAPVILLEGAYSAGPALSDLVQLSLLLQMPVAERHSRLAAREPADFIARWHELWDPVEAYYFTHIRPPQRFDHVLEV